MSPMTCGGNDSNQKHHDVPHPEYSLVDENVEVLNIPFAY